MDQKLRNKIKRREEEGTLRSLSLYDGMIDFVSNDYLGLSTVEYNEKYQGSTGSRLISGNHTEMHDAENILSLFFGAENALCFNSGYNANLGIFSSIPQKGDVVLYDEHIHASVRDGLRLSLARSYSFKHNDCDDLERLLKKSKDATIYVAIEALYSMGGDLSPLQAIADLCHKYEANLIVDEAHSAGVYGEDGRGYVSELALEDRVFIRLITFGKAYGSHGACVLCNEEVKTYLINFCRPFIYSTALPVGDYKRMKDIVRVSDWSERKSALDYNISLFRSQFEGFNLSSDERSPIQIIRSLGKEELRLLAEKMNRNNLAVKMIYPPTVQPGDECIRICIHSFNDKSEIKKLSQLFVVD